MAKIRVVNPEIRDTMAQKYDLFGHEYFIALETGDFERWSAMRQIQDNFANGTPQTLTSLALYEATRAKQTSTISGASLRAANSYRTTGFREEEH